jgi:hypothetical protein
MDPVNPLEAAVRASQDPRATPSPHWRPPLCRRCDYDLRGLSRGFCPECGKPYDVARPHTVSRKSRLDRRRQWVRRFVVAGLLVGVWASLLLILPFLYLSLLMLIFTVVTVLSAGIGGNRPKPLKIRTIW